MSVRRMMLFTLGGIFKSIISLFKTRVLNDGGTFEAETKLENQLNTLGSTLFDSASLVITPNGVKTSKLYTIKPNDGTGDLSVTRATTATRVNESGVIVDVPANVARIDYSTGQPTILVEPQRTNLVFPSDIATTQVRAVTAQVYTLSFYGTGTVTLSGAFSGSLVGTGTNNRVSLTFTPTAGNLTLTVNGSVTNWQLEAGSNATSLIKTVSGSVTRNADSISKTNVLNTSNDFTFYFEDYAYLNQTSQYFSFSSPFSAYLSRYAVSQQTLRFRYNSTNYTFSAPLGVFKFIIKKDNVSMKLFFNGILAHTITTLPTGLSTFSLIESSCIKSMFFNSALTDTQAIQLTTL